MNWADELDSKTANRITMAYYGMIALAVTAIVVFLGIPAAEKVQKRNQEVDEAFQSLKRLM